MAKFSVSEAATAGFGLIGREPLAVVGWTIVLLLSLGVTSLLLFLAMGPDLHRLIVLAMSHRSGAETDLSQFREMAGLQSRMNALNMLFWLGASFVRAVLCAAVFRAILAPGQSAWAYLRVGSRELWLTLLLLVEQVLAMIAIVVIVLVLAVIVAIVAVSAGEGGKIAAAATAVGGGVIAAGLLLWVALRLSMAAPMTFVDNQFRLFESWSLTKGQGWRLLGVGLLLAAFLIALELLIGGLVVALLFTGGAMTVMAAPGGLEAFLARPPITVLRDLWPWIAAWATFGALFGAAAQAILYAPWAVIHRALTGEEA
ncbi:hypothetical protein [uncultured Caulobacter sp.]|uniref:hypothetical protein n=1 Tax=uncultured Caulobacter sp. TaxID=158749 RepID=UPI00262B22AB|nr:hypothetical protein [uncultured Caulobacter sp.]